MSKKSEVSETNPVDTVDRAMFEDAMERVDRTLIALEEEKAKSLETRLANSLQEVVEVTAWLDDLVQVVNNLIVERAKPAIENQRFAKRGEAVTAIDDAGNQHGWIEKPLQDGEGKTIAWCVITPAVPQPRLALLGPSATVTKSSSSSNGKIRRVAQVQRYDILDIQTALVQTILRGPDGVSCSLKQAWIRERPDMPAPSINAAIASVVFNSAGQPLGKLNKLIAEGISVSGCYLMI